jgi:hypothetical protein
VASGYFIRMLARRVRRDGFIEPCIPTRAAKPPAGPAWVHEVKHDGYRLIVRREGGAVCQFTAAAMTGPTAIPPSQRPQPSRAQPSAERMGASVLAGLLARGPMATQLALVPKLRM